ncbi:MULTISPECIES: GGDEF domain-containing protein [unclassified Mesorhizobium]|uniref:GGDEF domain-containing protein n=1 Tax=unclassified Mesorhizobium TaxID=325217 RepID=UPI0011278A8F|nr:MULTISPECIES: GGDEF domain-containing protein [unclassified Mesorhizobium]MBZ9897199.1 GGDEF domain-containing protein [Mesorhizobium sp. BR1-1-6]TPK57118.1 GGDEF domain-containing protein [Mesorhizobium sp. B2-5-2]TPL20694.1 GGDEF domain-containing protein [Mesorhizobium sp. B2-4-7]TPL27268.1 GGDEF domain-containing protein [Mesorhizobium sp. B2-4-9]TPL36935.1 GGDEF domain-containing protein [Mesorhizobium sp. B2-4-5]
MQPAAAQSERSTDIASTVLATMRQLGVLGLPRNYEIFYEALSGSNRELSLAVVSLSGRPTQDDIDQIGRAFFAQNHGSGIVEHAREVIANELEDIASLLRSERSHIEKYGRILNETSSGLGRNSLLSPDVLQKIVNAMAVATHSTIDHGRQVASTLSDKTAELESVKSKLEEYKRLADTDPLTQIWNRRAFDKEITRIYNSNKGILFNALILADIDRFKDINDRYGHPVGDKILQIIADIFQTSIRADMFVARTGGEEFALIVEGASEDATYEIAERIRALIEQSPFTSSQTGMNYGTVTVSMGICMASEAEGPEDLYSKADRALYRSKVSGRNRVTRHSAMAGRAGKSWLLYKQD